ncbi:MAG: C-GCAxxG-C-C family protein, partial [Clostridium sp.]|nr:C-GCAxxG-C-C family protein [Clostridium sp.]MCI7444432.1 C-GCAxxG-C-C family protein [Clostridium sp.]
EFREKNTSVICRELKGVDTNVVLRSCDGCIEDAARIAYNVLFK